MKKPGIRRILYGVVFIAVGVVILGHMAHLWNLGYLARGWWTLFLIVPGIAGILASGFEFWNCFLVILGLWFYFEAQGWLGDNSFLWLLGASLIAFGIWTLTGGSKKAARCAGCGPGAGGTSNFSRDDNDYPEYACVFAQMKVLNSSKSFRGGKASGVFGKLTLDLRGAQITGHAVLDVAGVFGSVEIYLPEGVSVRTSVVPVFGSYRNNSVSGPAGQENALLEIKGASVFGSVTIY